MLEHIERLKVWQALELPAGIERQVYQNRLSEMEAAARAASPGQLQCIDAAHARQRVPTAAGGVTPDQPGR